MDKKIDTSRWINTSDFKDKFNKRDTSIFQDTSRTINKSDFEANALTIEKNSTTNQSVWLDDYNGKSLKRSLDRSTAVIIDVFKNGVVLYYPVALDKYAIRYFTFKKTLKAGNSSTDFLIKNQLTNTNSTNTNNLTGLNISKNGLPLMTNEYNSNTELAPILKSDNQTLDYLHPLRKCTLFIATSTENKMDKRYFLDEYKLANEVILVTSENQTIPLKLNFYLGKDDIYIKLIKDFQTQTKLFLYDLEDSSKPLTSDKVIDSFSSSITWKDNNITNLYDIKLYRINAVIRGGIIDLIVDDNITIKIPNLLVHSQNKYLTIFKTEFYNHTLYYCYNPEKSNEVYQIIGFMPFKTVTINTDFTLYNTSNTYMTNTYMTSDKINELVKNQLLKYNYISYFFYQGYSHFYRYIPLSEEKLNNRNKLLAN